MNNNMRMTEVPEVPRTRRQHADRAMANAMTRAEKDNEKGQHDKAWATLVKGALTAAKWLDGTRPKLAKASDGWRATVRWHAQRSAPARSRSGGAAHAKPEHMVRAPLVAQGDSTRGARSAEDGT